MIEEAKVTLTFPKERCTETEFKGRPMITVDTDMTAQELIMMLMGYAASGESVAAAVKKEDENDA